MALVVPPTLSVIVSVWMETLFYGMNCVIYFLCIYDLLLARKYASTTTKYFLVSSTTILFLVATAHMGVNCRRLIEGYVNPPSKLAMFEYLLDITEPTNVAKQFLTVFANTFSDILITWRVYMVWERNLRICILNIILSFGTFITGIIGATYVSRVIPGQNIFIRQVAVWGRTAFSFALAMNVSATLLIASRIWFVTRPIRAQNPERMRPYWRVIIIIVESAAFAAVAQVIQLAFYASDFPGVYFVSDTVVQIVVMNPLIIIAFVGRARRQQQSSMTFVASDRMLSEPVYATPERDTEASHMHFDKPVRLTLLRDNKRKMESSTSNDSSSKGYGDVITSSASE